MKVVLFAGGKGTRISEESHLKPKPMIEIGGKPIWMGLGMALGFVIPVIGGLVSLVFGILIGIGVAEKFGKSQGFGVGLGLLGLVFYPILGFGDAQYEGATAEDINDEVLDA